MFGGYDDIEAFEDDIYCEESSSETSVDSEIEFHLYSQVHYAQALGDGSGQEETEEAGPVEKQIQRSVSKQNQKDNLVVISDSDVIQISDSPDVIILSDTPDEDSVYRSKLQKLTTPDSPTLERTYSPTDPISVKPAKDSSQAVMNSKGLSTDTSRKEKRINQKSVSFHRDGVRMIHKILVIEDSSSNEDEDVASTVSESDNVESWMLLGGARDIKDENILLNLEGCGSSSTEGEGGTDWAISDKDLEAQIGNYVTVRRNNRYYMPDKNVTCRNCDKRGHLSKNCPTPKKVPPCCLCAERGHLQNNCPARFCLNCCLPGHFSRECIERTYWSKHCNRCAMRGHYADACPEIWRQYHLTTRPGPLRKTSSFSEHSAPVYCYNCSQQGHYGYECSERRMFGGTFPTFPFIYYYDNEYDIKRSLQKAKKKVQELQEAGLLPLALKRPHIDDDQKVYTHRKKVKLLKEHNKHHRKLKKKYQADKVKGRKHKKDVQSNYNTEENFPRGGHMKALKWHKKNSAHCDLSANGDKPEITKASLEAAKKRKKKKKQNYTVSTPTRDESLFLIKQRKKKSKQKPGY
ncbi:PREDICTED: zinc finger CCHC domain-containing protein 7 [Gekko japonicus]|uniref:Zinc finger CCHC domain-containing protein 7 n=1 Tax=Gekko japonicus TaxID=146911 RepID=A0ABM1KE03_GEKJA|nr:PREDICTED: zinc finger CCHC domain-containing protein 7 [Gekko japonicus]XP_015271940.1 PREDICTED: zinc finger CCHC domain-containing protein 7 [Gekko japonicus]